MRLKRHFGRLPNTVSSGSIAEMKPITFAILAISFAFSSALSAKTIPVNAGDDAQTRLQEALIVAEPGDVVQIGEGLFQLTDGLSLDVSGVTVRGAGDDKTILDFSGQKGAGEGILVTSDDVVLRDFAVQNTKGDGIKSKGADRIVYHQLTVEWTRGPNEGNGAYGIYPVDSKDVLVDGVLVRGASDAGIYVGQSRGIVVRKSIVMQNVAGIEIENSFDADVFDNIAASNTGGILVFDLPNLPQMGGHNVRIFDNIIVENNTPNFAPKGNIVANVPSGTGVMVMANRNVEVFGNSLSSNNTSNVMVVGYRFPHNDPKYDPLPKSVSIWGNKHDAGPYEKSGTAPGFAGGELLATAFGGALPPVMWDGAGGEAYAPAIGDKVAAFSLGLTDIKQPQSEAKPVPFVGKALPDVRLPAIRLPAAMEAAVK